MTSGSVASQRVDRDWPPKRANRCAWQTKEWGCTSGGGCTPGYCPTGWGPRDAGPPGEAVCAAGGRFRTTLTGRDAPGRVVAELERRAVRLDREQAVPGPAHGLVEALHGRRLQRPGPWRVQDHVAGRRWPQVVREVRDARGAHRQERERRRVQRHAVRRLQREALEHPVQSPQARVPVAAPQVGRRAARA